MKKKYDEVLEKLSDMTYYTERLMQENRKYKKFIEDFQLGVNLFPKKGDSKQLLKRMENEIQSPIQEKWGLNQSVWDPKKSALPDFKHSFNLRDHCFKKVNSDVKKRKKSKIFMKASPIQLNKRFSGSGKK
jgi:hypothetical protein